MGGEASEELGGNVRDIFSSYTFSGVTMKVIFGLKSLKTVFSEWLPEF